MKNKHLIFIIIGLVTLLRLIYINYLPLLGDEAYYWQWARHLDWGYYEQGPVIAIVIWLFTLFTNINTLFTIRLGAVLLSAGSMLALYFTFKKLYPEDKGALLTILLLLSSLIFSIGSILMMHDTIMVFFYSLFLYNLTNLINEPDKNKNWCMAGILLGVGIMAKLTMGVVYFGMIGFLLSSGTFKKYFKGFILFSFFTLVFTLPIIYWNITHDFATVRYLFIRGASSGHFTFKYLLELLGAQAALVSPLLFLLFIPSAYNSLKKCEFSIKHSFAIIFIITIIPFFLLSLKSRVEANWPAFTFLPLFFLVCGYLKSLPSKVSKILSDLTIISGLIIVLLVHIQAVFPLLKLPEKNNPLKKAYGFSELAIKTNNIYNALPQKDDTFLASRHYQTASLLSFYTPKQPEFFVLVSSEANKNFRFWKGWQKSGKKNALFVYSEPWESWEMAKFFDKKEFTQEIDVAMPGNNMRKYYVDYFTDLK